jgi:hypothetical protein
MYHWSPLEVKNLEPAAEMVSIARTELISARAATTQVDMDLDIVAAGYDPTRIS